jgi:trehalose 6-phosphate phosphatase
MDRRPNDRDPGPRYDEPSALARLIDGLARPALIGLDVDGVLAPITHHADHAELVDGVGPLLARLADEPGARWHVAVVSGRSLDDLHRFEFPPNVTVVGSHGMESHGVPLELTASEATRLRSLTALGRQAVDAAGPGAWLEEKPASVAVHVRQAEGAAGRDALAELAAAVTGVDGATAIAGSAVLELFVREASKGEALRALRGRLGVARAVFVGDDVTDEAAFAVLEPGDVRIKVGDAETIAEHRLRDPAAVADFLELLSRTGG